MADVISNDGPVLNLINKRLRALRKKLNRITSMEQSLSQGKSLNSEQLETLKSKPSILASIDELDKLKTPLSLAVKEEIQLNSSNSTTGDDKDKDNDMVLELIKLIYFGNVFDVTSLMGGMENLMMRRIHERSCCLTYDYVTEEDEEREMLREKDLDFISGVKELVVSRGVGEGLSHQKALDKCVERAKLWLEGSQEMIQEGSGVTYAGLREKLNKIMASEYFTTTPEIKAPVEVEAAGAKFTSFPAYGTADASANVNVSVGDSVAEQQEEDNKSPNSHGNESYNDKSGLAEEQHQQVQGGSDADNKSEQPAEAGMGVPNTEADQNSKDVDNSKDQQYSSRRSYQNRGGRGFGGRRNYPNGRGGRGGYRGGGPQNGRGHYHDQQSGYYPRNQNYRGRGGRGMGGNYSYREPAEHASHAQEA